MRGYRFLASRRWVLFAAAVLVLAGATWWLGQWQFDRLGERRAANDVVRTNEALAPAPVGEVMDVGEPVDPDQEWRRVTATGTYAVQDTVIVRYRTGADGLAGVNVVVPLVTDSGAALVVDRGFLATANRVVGADEVPDPPAGEVTVTGWVRVDGTGPSTQVADLATRAISSVEIGEAVDLPVYGGFVDLLEESPAAAEPLAPRELPELNDGPHFFYGLQWWFFGLLALFGFGYLAYDERKRGPRGQRPHRRQRAPRPPREPRERRTNVPAAYQRPRSPSSR